MIHQGFSSWVIILLILITYLLTVYGYCVEKIDLGHYWDLKGYYGKALCQNERGAVNLGSSIKEAGQCIFPPGLAYSKLG